MKKYFQFEELGTNYRREIIGGLTTFLAMAYILVVNPLTLSLSSVKDVPDALRMDQGAVFVATAVAAAVGSLFMGLIAKYPIALAPGMGLNAFFAYTVMLTYGIPWQTGLAGVLCSGLIFIALSLSGLREAIINAIPNELKQAVGAGIGLFIAFIGLQSAGVVVNNDAVLVGIGNLRDPHVLLAVFGVLIAIIMMIKKVNGAIFYGMVISTVIGALFGLIPKPTAIVGEIPSLAPTFGAAFEPFFHDIGSLFTLKFLIVVLTFLFVDFFDTAGTLISVANQAGLVKNGKLPRAGKALLADALATTTGAIFGTSTTTAYVESTAGVAAGARTGFASIVTAALFLLALFFSPLLSIITPAITAPALIIVGILMVSSIGQIEWSRLEIAVPSFFVLIAMPLTYSIATGIAIGFIFYPITMGLAGRRKEIHPLMYAMAVLFIAYFAFVQPH